MNESASSKRQSLRLYVDDSRVDGCRLKSAAVSIALTHKSLRLRCVAVRVNDAQLVMLSERAHYDHSLTGYLHKRAAESTKWQLRWFVLYQVSELFAVLLTIARAVRLRL